MEAYHDKVIGKMDEYVNLVYLLTTKFPREEIFISVSQWRRAALSIVLNYIEGYARRKLLVRLNFLEISYGSLKESKYLQSFAYNHKYINEEGYLKLHALSNEIGAILWTEIINIEKSLKR